MMRFNDLMKNLHMKILQLVFKKVHMCLLSWAVFRARTPVFLDYESNKRIFHSPTT